MDREGIDEAWVGHLPSAYYRDPSVGNAQLYSALVPHAARLHPAPTIRPDWPGWDRALEQAANAGAAAVRAYPAHWQLGPHSPRMLELALACGEARLPLLLTVRFEDLRQRSPLDTAGELTAAAIRALARAGDVVRLVVTAAGRDMIEEVHWGLTPQEQRRVVWDISWIWGPPEDHLAKLFRTIGAERFVFGTHWPLRLSQNAAREPGPAAGRRGRRRAGGRHSVVRAFLSIRARTCATSPPASRISSMTAEGAAPATMNRPAASLTSAAPAFTRTTRRSPSPIGAVSHSTGTRPLLIAFR